MFRQIYAKRGVAGLYAGIIPEYAKVVPGVAIAFCSYEVRQTVVLLLGPHIKSRLLNFRHDGASACSPEHAAWRRCGSAYDA